MASSEKEQLFVFEFRNDFYVSIYINQFRYTQKKLTVNPPRLRGKIEGDEGFLRKKSGKDSLQVDDSRVEKLTLNIVSNFIEISKAGGVLTEGRFYR